jgi:1,4-dihydroxy-2-naphthoate octaprenyltransferase
MWQVERKCAVAVHDAFKFLRLLRGRVLYKQRLSKNTGAGKLKPSFLITSVFFDRKTEQEVLTFVTTLFYLRYCKKLCKSIKANFSEMTADVSLVVKVAQLARLRFLAYSPIMFFLGIVLAHPRTGSFTNILQALLLWWTNHANTHFFNEYYDFEADQANEGNSKWTGGSRVLKNGLLDRNVSLYLGIATTIFYAIQMLFLPTFKAQVLAFLLALVFLGYSIPPLQFSYRGLGELCVVLELNILLPLFAAVSVGGNISFEEWVALVPLMIIQYNRMMVMNMADIIGDAKAGKKTLIVRIGLETSIKTVYSVGQVVAYSMLVYVAMTNVMWKSALLAFCLTGDMALAQYGRLHRVLTIYSVISRMWVSERLFFSCSLTKDLGTLSPNKLL